MVLPVMPSYAMSWPLATYWPACTTGACEPLSTWPYQLTRFDEWAMITIQAVS